MEAGKQPRLRLRFAGPRRIGTGALLALGVACRTEPPPEAGLRVNQNGILARLEASGRNEGDGETQEGETQEGETQEGEARGDGEVAPNLNEPSGLGGATSEPGDRNVEHAVTFDIDTPADRDPTNDSVVAPPEPIPACHAELERRGVVFVPGAIPLREAGAGKIACGAYDAVVYQKGPTGLAISPPALVTCKMAFGLLALEQLAQNLSEQHFGQRLKKLHQGGTYSCRKMARFDLVSEHSYGNAIDVRSFTLSDGSLVSVERHFGKKDAPPSTPRAAFLREFGQKAFDRNLVSVSLGPYWDTLHGDHFHFDLARYRVDGSRANVVAVEEGR